MILDNTTGNLSAEILRIAPLTLENWDDFEQLFEESGSCNGCWCMSFRLKKRDFEEGLENDGNKKAMLQIVSNEQPAGLIGYFNNKPIAWCALAPRKDFIRVDKLLTQKPFDDAEVWSLPCYFIAKNHRKNDSVPLLKKLIEYAKENGINILEAYPTLQPPHKLTEQYVWDSNYRVFESAGFEILNRSSKMRPIARCYLDKI